MDKEVILITKYRVKGVTDWLILDGDAAQTLDEAREYFIDQDWSEVEIIEEWIGKEEFENLKEFEG